MNEKNGGHLLAPIATTGLASELMMIMMIKMCHQFQDPFLNVITGNQKHNLYNVYNVSSEKHSNILHNFVKIKWLWNFIKHLVKLLLHNIILN